MPLGLNRTGDFRNGTPINTSTHNFGNVVNWTPSPDHFGNAIPSDGKNKNDVTWTPSPDHFGNSIS